MAVVATALLVLTGLAVQAPPDPEPGAQDAAVAFLLEQEPAAEVLEALLATGTPLPPDATDFPVPEAPQRNPNTGLRPLHALLAAGARVHDDPERGTLSLEAEWRGRAGAVLEAPAAGTLGFWLLSAHHLQADEPGVDAAVDALVAPQADDGGFPCLFGFRSLDCTGFAGAALAAPAALERIDGAAAAAHVQGHAEPGGGYTDGFLGRNAQSTAWALTALRLLDAEPDAQADAAAWLEALRRPDGSYDRDPGQPDPLPWWTTAEVVVALSGGHPLPVRPADAPAA